MSAQRERLSAARNGSPPIIAFLMDDSHPSHPHAASLAELERRHALAEEAGGAERRERQHRAGKLSARERVELLLDPGTFEETDKFVTHRATDFGMDKQRIPGDGFITGYGAIDGRTVFVYRAGLHRLRRLALGDQRRQDRQDHGHGDAGRRADYRAERLRRRAHPGGRRLARRIRGHLPAQHAGFAGWCRSFPPSWAPAPAALSTRPPSPISSSW